MPGDPGRATMMAGLLDGGKDNARLVNQHRSLLGYTGTYIGNIRRAAPSVKYYLPNMGYRDAGTQDMLTNGFDFGCEFVY